MSNFTDFKAEIRGWAGRESTPDNIINGWITMLEARVNREMRVGEMVQRDTASIQSSEIVLPGDWLQTEYLRYVTTPGSNSPDIRFGRPILPKTNDNFWEACNDPDHPDHLKSFFTTIGLNLLINPNVQVSDGIQLEIGYYAKVPALSGNATNWLYDVYHDIYLYGALGEGGMYLVEDERVPLWQAAASSKINTANDAWARAKTSGGPLKPRFRSFG